MDADDGLSSRDRDEADADREWERGGDIGGGDNDVGAEAGEPS